MEDQDLDHFYCTYSTGNTFHKLLPSESFFDQFFTEGGFSKHHSKESLQTLSLIIGISSFSTAFK